MADQDKIKTSADPALVEMRNIWKRFPGVIANQAVDLDLLEGEVHALLGENGAGKTTLMYVLSGMYRPEAGTIRIAGREMKFKSPSRAIRAGVGIVHQHFRLVEKMTAAENIHLGWGETPKVVSARALAEQTERICQQFGLTVDPGARIWQLSTGEQQRVEILRVLARGARILILDEPTSVLTPNEAVELFNVTRKLAQSGRTVVLITHKLDEVIAASDRVTVMRQGRVVARRETASCDQATLARLTIGEDLVSEAIGSRGTPGKELLEVNRISARDNRNLPALREISFTIRAGEILGVAGVAGNGQSELAEVLTGLRRLDSGSVVVGGKDLSNADPIKCTASGVGHIPEDRLGMGLVGGASLIDNSILREYRSRPISRGIFIERGAAVKFSRELVEEANVITPNVRIPAQNLSGGNQQRLLVGRESRVASRLLVAMHPTQGLDIGAMEAVRRNLIKKRDSGSAVLLISEDLDEVLLLSSRIIVLYEGRIAGEFDRSEAHRETIGLLMGGGGLKSERRTSNFQRRTSNDTGIRQMVD
ncbi:MAG: ABC transporter ATP-binding protein [Candidatus Auribacterota bacterium]|nr:ABC transporter ATP-binding protein [Candidatus Auribacterota bacterium]